MYPIEPGPAFFIQPHYDDVALSCGGTAALFAGAGHPPLIVTVFGGEVVEEMVGDFAAWKHSRWQIGNVDEVIDRRREEDAAAADALGCAYRWLGLPDAIYRGDRYKADHELFGAIQTHELALAEHLALELRGLPEWVPGTRLFVPLGVGAHVDHQLVFETGCLLARQGVEVFAYEDCPYVIHTPSGLDERLAKVKGRLAEPIVVPLGKTMNKRVEATGCYRSQLPVIFRFTDDYAAALEDYALKIGGSAGPAERFWPVLG